MVIVLVAIVILVLITAVRTIRIIPQSMAGVVERLGRYSRTLAPGLAIVIPYVDRVRPLIDMREQVVSFAPQPVITEDNVVVQIDSVLYYTINDARAVTYEIANHLQAIEQLTTTTLRNVIGGMTLENALTSRDEINTQLRVVLDEATGKWGIRVNRVELKAIDPPGITHVELLSLIAKDSSASTYLYESSGRSGFPAWIESKTALIACASPSASRIWAWRLPSAVRMAACF